MKTIKIANIAKTAAFAVVAGAVALGVAGPAEAAAPTLYGDPAAAAKWWRYQKYDDCVLMASADVIGQVTGKEPSEEAIIKLAQSTPSTDHPGSIYTKPADTKNPNSGMGTSPMDVPTLLAQYQVGSVVTDKNHAPADGYLSGIEGLKKELAAGNKIIVGVNAEVIWHNPVEQKDDRGNPRADHAVVVTGVDTATNMVHLNDSGIRAGRDSQIPVKEFLKAWDASLQMMIVTVPTGH
jgi:Peptidase_C39 like family